LKNQRLTVIHVSFWKVSTLPLIVSILLSLMIALVVQAQPASPCGVVDAIDYPIEPLAQGYDDFGLYRARFGGNHLGLDLGFNRWKAPVKAAMRGQVRYADPEGWDTEKGVVILAHTMPDNTLVYSVYGHMEQTDTIFFPAVSDCVERGQVIGVVGWPSRGRPHLHYEIRSILLNDGGPGYITGNPLTEGWFNPLDFTAVWRARMNPAFLSYVSFDLVASLPPAQLESGAYVIASDDTVSVVWSPNQVLWRVRADSPITGIAALSGDRVVAHAQSGQTLTLENGRYVAIWTVNAADKPFAVLGERLIFLMPDGGLSAYDPAGTPIWSMPGTSSEVISFNQNGDQLALVTHSSPEVLWRQINQDGQVVSETSFNGTPTATPLPNADWLVLADGTLTHLATQGNSTIATQNLTAGHSPQITGDQAGNAYVYLDDAQRTLVALNADGTLRWRTNYPRGVNSGAPLLAAGKGCLLYTLDIDGMLNTFNAGDGNLINQIQLYAGGRRNSRPEARLLRVDAAEQVYVATGFLSMLIFDGRKLGGEVTTC
jgi:murein DD-endopeptidase MepM/ murein hydrolase activator NlpD